MVVAVVCSSSCSCLSIYLSLCLSVCLSLSLCLSVRPSAVCLSVCLPAWLAGWLSVFLQVWKQSYPARLPQFLNLTMSETKQICETTSIFEVDNIKNEAILQDFLQKWKVECRAHGLVPLRFAIFPLHLSKVHTKKHTKCCTCHAKSSSQNWRICAPKCNPSQEISALIS